MGSQGDERRLKVAVTKCECRDGKVEEEGEGLVQKCPTHAPRPRTLKNSKENICTDERWDKLYKAQRIRLEINTGNTWKGSHRPIKNQINLDSHLNVAPNKCSFINFSTFYAFKILSKSTAAAPRTPGILLEAYLKSPAGAGRFF